MTEMENAVLSAVREMRAEMDRGFRDLKGQIRDLEARIVAFDLEIGAVRKFAAGDSLVGRYAAAAVENRLAAIEARLSTLEHRTLSVVSIVNRASRPREERKPEE
ncbi:MAG: hypothetical protein HXX10_00745 [Rhodoplanes sp.]|uniref:hypothetical protein n=1 Tax=Rhodoplanes sp. TaxID=1968906 RepID=UPI0017BB522B|nr:hypothetical protein [Rhodoplanes sp.]NVO12542.1 hypothetical protein [Rhodoplanes sp.]